MKKWFFILAASLLSLTGCGSGGGGATAPNDLTPLTSIVISANLETLATGTSTRLVAVGDYSGAYTKDLSDQVTWKSLTTNIADFVPGNPGRLKATLQGTAQVTSTFEGIEGSFNLNVIDKTLSTLVITPMSLSLPQGLQNTITVEGTFTDATQQDLTFDAVWSSSDETVATISNGVITALKVGTTTISATFGGVTAVGIPLTVIAPVPVSIVVNPASSTLLSLMTRPYTATGNYADGSTFDLTTGVTWASSNPAVATIAADGTVKTLTPGTTTISATLGTVSGTSTLKVTGGRLTSINLLAATSDQIRGTFSRITATGTFDNGTTRDITGAIENWTVADPTKATVIVETGNLAWVNALDVTTTATAISARHGNITSSTPILLSVADPVLTPGSLNIPETIINLTVGTSIDLSLTGIFVPANVQDLAFSAVWTSLTPATATVGNLIRLEKGRVRALAPGTVQQITAAYGDQVVTTTFNVVARTLQSLTISVVPPLPLQMIAGAQEEFRVVATYTDTTTQDVTADATWLIDDLNVVNFSDKQLNPGLIVAVDAGSATLSATFGGMSVTENIIVQ